MHADGEIWAQTLWDLRTALGPAKARALVTTGMSLLAPEPSFLDARNAILVADQTLYGGADAAALWTVFAGRGMGFFAASTGGDDTAPAENFALPPAAGRAARHDHRPRHGRARRRGRAGRHGRARRRAEHRDAP